MDPKKAFEIINNIVANAPMNRKQHEIAAQALMLLQPVPDDQGIKEIVDDE